MSRDSAYRAARGLCRTRTADARWAARVSVVISMLVAMLAIPGAPAGANNTQSVVVGIPFSGRWAYNVPATAPWNDDVGESHPAAHNPYGSDWATDVYAAPGTAVKLLLSNATGPVTLSVSNVASTSCGAGKRLRVNISVSGVSLGYVQYEHLQTTLSNGSTVSPGSTLGTVQNWGNLSCYRVSGDAGTHAHVAFANTTRYSCFVDHGRPGATTLAEGTPLGILGSNNSGPRQPCLSVPGGANDLPDGDGDGLADSIDRCPHAAGSAAYRGCPGDDSTGRRGDFNGDGFDDVVSFYNYGLGDSAILFAAGSATGLKWDSGTKWRSNTGFEWERTKLVAGDFNGDGRDDLGALYDYGGSSAGLIVWPGGATFGQGSSRTWFTPSGWNWDRTKLSVGDFNGDGFDDVVSFYNYGLGDSAILFAAGSATGLKWDSGTKWRSNTGFEWERTKLVAGDFNGDGRDDLGALYDYGGSSAGLIVWPGGATFGQGSSRTWFTPSGWNWDRTKSVGGASPCRTPSAPRNPTLVAGHGAVTARWVKPTKTGGTPISSYTATATPGGRSCSSVGTSCVIGGLTNGTLYRVSVRASNTVGAGPASPTSQGARPLGIDPVGRLDLATSPSSNRIRVRGWMLDWSSPLTSTEGYVVVGGRPGTPGTERFSFRASSRRDDVASAYPGAGNTHGYDVTLATNRTGTQIVCVVAKNFGAGTDREIGCETLDVIK